MSFNDLIFYKYLTLYAVGERYVYSSHSGSSTKIPTENSVMHNVISSYVKESQLNENLFKDNIEGKVLF